ncbi:hypothetical protein HMPREF9374_2155 [Desmospora sp. 8437]|nr:hypothetical protein HMPREF9374_2155 [Desmospora sp. 8437]
MNFDQVWNPPPSVRLSWGIPIYYRCGRRMNWHISIFQRITM